MKVKLGLSRKLLERVEANAVFVRYAELGVREGLFSDMVGALGQMRKKVVACAVPELVGRRLIEVQFTKKAMERFPLDRKVVGYCYAEGSVSRLSGQTSDEEVTMLLKLASNKEVIE